MIDQKRYCIKEQAAKDDGVVRAVWPCAQVGASCVVAGYLASHGLAG